MQLHQKLINLFIPQILRPSIFKKLFLKMFVRNKNIENFLTFEKNFYTRQAFINKAISMFDNCKYLEIGVANNVVFNSIPLKMSDKFGIDHNNEVHQ